MRILVWNGKHATQYFDASSVEALDASSIEILGQLIEMQYLGEVVPYIPEKTAELAKIDLGSLDEFTRGVMHKDVTTAKNYVDREERTARAQSEEYREALSYIEAGRSPHVTLGVGTKWEKTVPKSWQILDARNGFEYEDYDLVDVKRFKPVDEDEDA